MANPWDNDPIVEMSGPQTVTVGRRDPSKVRAEERAQDTAARAAAAAERQADTAARGQSDKVKEFLLKVSNDYNGDPAVKAYRVAIGQLGQALSTGDGPQADLALTYAFAKAMDPDSVVRESEQGMVTSSQPWFQAMVEKAKKQFNMDGAGNFTPEARDALRKQISNSVAQRVKVYEARRRYYEDQAQQIGVDPKTVLGAHDAVPFVPALREWVGRVNGANGQQAENEIDKVAAVPDNSPPDLPPANAPGGSDPMMPASGGGLKDIARPDINSMVQSMMAAGAGYSTINAALKAKNASPISFGAFAQAKKWMEENPGKAYPVDAKETRELSWLERGAGSPLGAAAAHYANTATAGTAAALAGDRGQGALDAMERMNPGSALTGNLLGGITGAVGAEAALGAKLAGTGLAKFAPRLGDAAYGGLYGFNEAEDGEGGMGALTGAATAVLGGALGERAMRGVGNAAKGVTEPAVQYLRNLGVPLTGGQVLGGLVKNIEDKATSTPIIGDMIAKRRMEGIEGFNRAAMDQAAAPIGFSPTEIGKAGIDQMMDAAGNSYDNATAGVNVPLDGQYATDFTDVVSLGQGLPDDLRARFGLALSNRVNPINDAGELTGESYQQAVRGLKSYKGETTKPGFEQDYRMALSSAQDALTAQMMRGGGDEVVSGLRAADDAYRGIKTVEDATMRADGSGYMFTPSQLQDALKKTNRKFPGSSPLTELADMGQEVLPSRIPDSGTAGRAAQLLMPGVVGGGAGYAASGDVGGAGMGGLGLTLALLAGGTKTGQKALTSMLLDRPAWLRELGGATARNSHRGGWTGAGVLTPILVND